MSCGIFFRIYVSYWEIAVLSVCYHLRELIQLLALCFYALAVVLAVSTD